jgi:MFS family permease
MERPAEAQLNADGRTGPVESSAEVQPEQGKHSIAESDGKKKGATGLWPFVIVSSSYLLYTTTDGAIRMIVLLHAYQKGFSAMEVAIMFTLYEVAGVVTNLLAGIAGSRWGLRNTLLVGLFLQLVGISSLFGWREDAWSKLESIIFVTFSQMLCGIAKDLTKLGGKTVAKLVTPDEKQTSLFRLVSFITGEFSIVPELDCL